MKPYLIQLEISGPTAMWTRPDTGSSPVSYVAPTFSAVKGIFESVLRWKSVNVRPTKVEICAPVQFHRPEGSEDVMTLLEWLQTKKRTRRYKGKDIPGGFLTPDEWRQLQPYIVHLSFPESKMTQAFLRASDSEPVFKNDDPVRGLRLLKPNSPLYHSGLNEPGLDVKCEALRGPANYML